MDQELKRNIQLTPQQRIEEHQKALNLLNELEKSKEKKKRERPQPSS